METHYRKCRAVQKLSCIFFMTFRSISASLRYCPMHVQPLRLTSLKRFLVAETFVLLPFSFRVFHSLLHRFFFFINTFRAVRAWSGVSNQDSLQEYKKRNGNHAKNYIKDKDVFQYVGRESNRNGKSCWLLPGERKRTVVPNIEPK